MHINMKKEKKYIEYILKQAEALLAIDSPSGFTEKVTDYLCEEYKRLGYKPVKTKKGGILVEIGGKGNAVLTMAHVDTLGGMVAEIKINGRLRLTKVGGLNANNIETENCRIYTLDGKVYEGTVQLTDASIHVNGDYQKSERTFDSVEVLLDEKVSSREMSRHWVLRTVPSSAWIPGPASRSPVTSRAVFWMTSSAPLFCLASQNM